LAASSLVLLKNQNQALPLSKTLKNVMVVGPLGDSQEDMIGSWNGDGHKEDAITLLAGIRAQLPEARVGFIKGCEVQGGAPIDTKALQQAWADAEVLVVAVGESAAMTGEATSRSSLDIPGQQLALLQAVQASGKPYVVVLMNGRPLLLNWLEEHAPAILETWFAGTEGGNAIADVLFGEVNPSGKLPVTFPRSLGQVPIYYSRRNTGRPAVDPHNKYESKYTDVSNEPLYPFGFGLSYTPFTYGNLAVSHRGHLSVSVDLVNDGARAGDEVAQLYIRGRVSSVARPVRQLRGFRKVHLDPGQKVRLEFALGPKELGFWNDQQHFVVEPGTFDGWVGGSSQASLGTQFQVP
jgi:beta-glucosidase